MWDFPFCMNLNGLLQIGVPVAGSESKLACDAI